MMHNARVSVLVCHSTCPDQACARRLARVLVEERLAACVQIVPGVESVYRWQGKIVEAQEWLLLIKTTAACWPVVRERLAELHPYEVPELLAVEVRDGGQAYLQWVRAETMGGVT